MNIDQKPPVFTSQASSELNGVSEDDRTTAMFCHLSALLTYVIPIPLANVVCPLVIWLMKKDESAYVDEQGREAVNFQITICLAVLVAIPLCFIMIGFFVLPAIAALQAVFSVLAALDAKNGKPYRYPLSLRLI